MFSYSMFAAIMAVDSCSAPFRSIIAPSCNYSTIVSVLATKEEFSKFYVQTSARLVLSARKRAIIPLLVVAAMFFI